MSAYDLLPCERPNHPDCNIEHKRLTTEARIVRHMIRQLKRHGWAPVGTYVDDVRETTTTETAMMDTVFSVDKSKVVFRNIESRQRHTIFLVLGNGVDVIADYSNNGNASFDALMNDIMDYAERQEGTY